MNDIESRAVRHLIDRQEILDCLTRYCRGIDRLDRELVLSAYHPDAIDNHGVFVGPPGEFWDWVHALHGTGQKRTFHTIANHSCEIDGDVAHAETYCLYFGLNQDDSLHVVGNRYIDRFQRLNDGWRIAERACVVEWYGSLNGGESVGSAVQSVMAQLMSNAQTSRAGDDVSYMRPLKVSRERKPSGDSVIGHGDEKKSSTS